MSSSNSVATLSYYEDYEYYDLTSHQRNKDLTVIEKKSLLLAAVVQNEVDVLEDLLDSPEWYNVTDKYDKTLLEIAILRDNHEVFDYMMSIPDFPIDYIDNEGYTALYYALEGFVGSDIWMSQHFAYELIKKGASIDVPFSDGNTAFHCALERSYNKVAILLIQKGGDLDSRSSDYTPLELALAMYEGIDEVVSALLIYGATPSVDLFNNSVLQNKSFLVQEQLFLYIVDEHSQVDIDLRVILNLAEKKSPLFHELLKYRFTVNISDIAFPYFQSFSLMDTDYLRIVVEKFHTHISDAFAKSGHENVFSLPDTNCVHFLEKLDLMLESALKSDVISIISIRSVDIFEDQKITKFKTEFITELYCYLLSYGLGISECTLNRIYSHFGYCELLKILLHMDIQITKCRAHRYVAAELLYDFKIDVNRFFEDPECQKWDADTVRELCKNFVHPRLKERYLDLVQTEEMAEIPNLPQIPLLTEIARNVFRKYFVETFQIKTSRKFYTLLNSLPISTVYKKILSYETKLYEDIL